MLERCREILDEFVACYAGYRAGVLVPEASQRLHPCDLTVFEAQDLSGRVSSMLQTDQQHPLPQAALMQLAVCGCCALQ